MIPLLADKLELNPSIPALTFVFTALLHVTSTFAGEANHDAICQQVKKSGKGSAFLIDNNNTMSRGPINFGKLPYSDDGEDYYIIPTKHKVIVNPAKLKIMPCVGSCLSLKKTNPLCPGTATYELSYSIINKTGNPRNTSWLPFKFDDYATFPNVEDPDEFYPPEITYHFERRIIGELYDAKKK